MPEAIRWNPWITVRPVRFEDEATPQARTARLACPAMRVGDPVRVEGGPTVIEGQIVAGGHSMVHMRRIQ